MPMRRTAGLLRPLTYLLADSKAVTLARTIA